ncbi:hypothetical protein M885DRAFT_589262 [Pelagophyceae sp. CCMP2097]|nr:hypothetical protein M885DRAFT_589262 [Pelagophyceae sp. CCMP2097]
MRLWPVSLLAWAAHGRMGGQQSRANCDFAPNNASVFQTPDVFQTPGAVTPGDGGSGAFGAFSAALQIRCKTSLSLPFAVGRRVGDSCACLQFLHTYAPLRRRTQGDFLLHTVWIGDCNSILELLIRSFIETQSDTQTLWVWLKGDVSKCFFKMRLDPKTNIVFKPLTDSKLSALCDGETEPRNCASWADLESRAKPPRIAHHSGSFQPKLGDVTFLSDQIRLLVLWRGSGRRI